MEKILCTDPAKIFLGMDFNSRNHYRTVIEDLARHSKYSEESVAQAAVELSLKAQNEPPDATPNLDRKTHVGYFLIDEGRSILEKQINYRPELNARLPRLALAHPASIYLGSISLISLLIGMMLLAYAYTSGASPAQMILTALLGSGLAL